MAYTQTAPSYKQPVLFWCLLGMLISAFLLYTYFLNATILNIVERKSVERTIAETNIHISELESAYMTASVDVTPDLAASLGFVESTAIAYAKRDASAGLARLGE